MNIFIAYPCYNGMCHVKSMECISALMLLCQMKGIKFQFFPLTSESLIPRARNVCACAFLKSECTHLLFVDNDIIFNPHDVLQMIDSKKDFICGLYPKKVMYLDDIKIHAESAKTIQELMEKTAHYAANYEPSEYGDKYLKEIEYAATGFTLITRNVFEEILEVCPILEYNNDIEMYKKYSFDGFLYNFFPVGIVNGRYVSEDFGISHIWKKMGNSIYADLRIKLVHIGQMHYYGNPLT